MKIYAQILGMPNLANMPNPWKYPTYWMYTRHVELSHQQAQLHTASSSQQCAGHNGNAQTLGMDDVFQGDKRRSKYSTCVKTISQENSVIMVKLIVSNNGVQLIKTLSHQTMLFLACVKLRNDWGWKSIEIVGAIECYWIGLPIESCVTAPYLHVHPRPVGTHRGTQGGVKIALGIFKSSTSISPGMNRKSQPAIRLLLPVKSPIINDRLTSNKPPQPQITCSIAVDWPSTI